MHDTIASRIVTEYTNGRTLQAFIDAVKTHGGPGKKVLVVDVRFGTRYPLDGRFYPGKLEVALRDENIGYRYVKELGNKYKNARTIEESKMLYLEYVVTTKSFADLVVMIRDAGDDDVFCLACYCQPPRPCHRFWLRDAIIRALVPGPSRMA